MRVKIVEIRDVAIIEMTVEACGDVFTFVLRGDELYLCGKTYRLNEAIGPFRRGVIILMGVPFMFECEGEVCIAAKQI